MNFVELKNQIDILNSKADFLHVDIMDGHYVKNLTLSPVIMAQIKKIAKIPMDAHLMVDNPSDYLDALAEAGACCITPHAETVNKDAFRTIYRIRELGCKAGIALNPATPLEYAGYYIHLLDKLTLMTVDAGYAAQRFVPEVLDKIKQAKKWKEENGYNYLIEVDGACNEKTYRLLADAGAEVFVMGSTGLFGLDEDLEKAWQKMAERFKRQLY